MPYYLNVRIEKYSLLLDLANYMSHFDQTCIDIASEVLYA